PARVMNSRRVVGRANRPQDWLRLVHIDELVEAKDRLAEISHCSKLIVFGRKGFVAIRTPLELAIDKSKRRFSLRVSRSTRKSESECGGHAFVGVAGIFRQHPSRKIARAVANEAVVQQFQRLRR